MNKTFQLFDLNIPEHPEIESPDVSLFKSNLKKQLLYLLEKDIATLWNGLYRIDVAESKVKEIFIGIPDTSEIAEKLSDLILKRIIQKMEIRRKYSNQNNTASDLDETL
ncbi:hypothetical protein [uncultured Cytophaga sp.]|uniref:hypothetical protein n=1 Tax=uncultured Cytophaga sp. TaxID=160238 RepID=UPI00261DBCFF|nr:hypothetical protein [uncultured Cytophaga sp.]